MNFGGQEFRGGRVQIQPGIRRFYGPKSAIFTLLRRIGSTYDYRLKEYVVNCNTVNQLPPLIFNFNQSIHVRLLPRDYTVKVSYHHQVLFMIGSDSKSTVHCGFRHVKSSNSKGGLANWRHSNKKSLFAIES